MFKLLKKVDVVKHPALKITWRLSNWLVISDNVNYLSGLRCTLGSMQLKLLSDILSSLSLQVVVVHDACSDCHYAVSSRNN